MLFNDISHYQDAPRAAKPNLSKWWDPRVTEATGA